MNLFRRTPPPPKKTFYQNSMAFGQSAMADPNKAFGTASKTAQKSVSSGISSMSSMGHSAVKNSNLSWKGKLAARAGLGMMSLGARTANMGFGMASRAVARSVLPPPPPKKKRFGIFGGNKSKRRPINKRNRKTRRKK